MKKENVVTKKKTLIKFILIMILSMLAGFVGAFAFDYILSIGADHIDVWEKLTSLVGRAIPITYVLTIILVLGLAYMNYFNANKMAAKWDGEDEDVIEKIESKLGMALTLCNIFMAFNFFLFSSTVEVANHPVKDMKINVPLMFFAAAMLLIGLTGNIIISVICVNLEKKLNPEKQGDALDMNFNKTWLASCDEAQQRMIYEAGYRAFKIGQTVCIFMWLVTLFGQLFFHTGIFPVVCVFVIYATLVISYSVSSIRLEIKKSV